MHMQTVMMPQGQIVNKRQANKSNASGKIIWIEKETRSARCAKVDVEYGHIKQERGGTQRKQK